MTQLEDKDITSNSYKWWIRATLIYFGPQARSNAFILYGSYQFEVCLLNIFFKNEGSPYVLHTHNNDFMFVWTLKIWFLGKKKRENRLQCIAMGPNFHLTRKKTPTKCVMDIYIIIWREISHHMGLSILKYEELKISNGKILDKKYTLS